MAQNGSKGLAKADPDRNSQEFDDEAKPNKAKPPKTAKNGQKWMFFEHNSPGLHFQVPKPGPRGGFWGAKTLVASPCGEGTSPA